MTNPALDTDGEWLDAVHAAIADFEDKHGFFIYSKTNSSFSLFEIGCFLRVAKLYEKEGYKLSAEGLREGFFRFLTTPAGNPINFSYVLAEGKDGVKFQLRQQVRVKPHKDSKIYFTPDIVVLMPESKIHDENLDYYAGGKKKFFSVPSSQVVTFFECKSMKPFPELLVGFGGFLQLIRVEEGSATGHSTALTHLAPTLMVGGKPSRAHLLLAEELSQLSQANYWLNLYRAPEPPLEELRRLDLHYSEAQVAKRFSIPLKEEPT